MLGGAKLTMPVDEIVAVGKYSATVARSVSLRVAGQLRFSKADGRLWSGERRLSANCRSSYWSLFQAQRCSCSLKTDRQNGEGETPQAHNAPPASSTKAASNSRSQPTQFDGHDPRVTPEPFTVANG